MIRTAIHGAAGRMGQRLVALLKDHPDLQLAAALERADHPLLGQDAGALAGVGATGIAVTQDLKAPVDVVIDFSLPDPAIAIADVCAEHGIALVMATTGFTERQLEHIDTLAKTIPLLTAPNMSVAVNLAMKLTEIAASALRDQSSGVDVEIIEHHHRYKEDSPSGTALRFGEIIAEQMGQTKHQHGRQGRPGARPANEIGYHALRAGDHPGQHTILFGLLGESVEIAVRATSRDSYAQGALACAKFLANKPPGRYHIRDVLGL